MIGLPFIVLRVLSHLAERHVLVVLADDGVSHLPNLEKVVFCGAANEPRVV